MIISGEFPVIVLTVTGGGVTLESFLGKMQDEIHTYSKNAVYLSAFRFFLQRVLSWAGDGWFGDNHGVTNYGDLCSRIDEWSQASGIDVVYVTFNYDTLLDRTLARSGILETPSIDSYVMNDSVALLKPHGSVNWFWAVERTYEPGADPSPVRDLIWETPEPAELAGVEVSKGGNLGSYVERGEAETGRSFALQYPAIAIPVAYKTDSTLILPDSHRQRLAEALQRASRVLAVGWRAAESHFLELLREVDPAVPAQVVCADHGADTIKNLQEGAGLTNVGDAAAGFSAYLASAALEEFLEAR